MKILHVVIGERYIEGMSYQENILPKKHKDLGYDTYLIASQRIDCSTFVDTGEYINKAGVKVSILKCRSKKFWMYVFFDKCIGFKEKLYSIKPDIIFIHGIVFKDIRHIISYKKEFSGTHIFADSHNDYYNSPVSKLEKILLKYFYLKRIEKFIPYCERFWGTTPWRVDYLHDVYQIPKEKTDLLQMGGDECLIPAETENKLKIRRFVRNEYNIPDDSFLVVTGGRLDRRKQQTLLMNAMRQLSGKNIYLLVFGNPTLDMEDEINEYKDIENIRLIGKIHPDNIYNMFIASDLAVFPGTHSVLWEQAIACGIPTVFKHWSGMEHVNICNNAILLDNVSVETLKKTIESLLLTSQYYKLKQMSEKAMHVFEYSKIAKKAIAR